MPSQLVSGSVVLTLLVGALISFFYVRFFWAALQRAVRTRHDAEDSTPDRYQYSLIGAVISVVVSSVVIIAYGVGPALLYLGPIAALLSPIAVTYCLLQELRS